MMSMPVVAVRAASGSSVALKAARKRQIGEAGQNKLQQTRGTTGDPQMQWLTKMYPYTDYGLTFSTQ
jgi:hypothetical protein